MHFRRERAIEGEIFKWQKKVDENNRQLQEKQDQVDSLQNE